MGCNLIQSFKTNELNVSINTTRISKQISWEREKKGAKKLQQKDVSTKIMWKKKIKNYFISISVQRKPNSEKCMNVKFMLNFV